MAKVRVNYTNKDYEAVCRYLLTVRSARDGSWSIFDAPEPWGPWTTVARDEGWLKGTRSQITYIFPTKWMGADGKTVWMISSAGDSLNVLKGTLALRQSGSPPR